MRVLAVGAHPDDLEILCAGTLARYARAGHEVVMAIATDGAAGHTRLDAAELARRREAEARAAAALLGAELIWLGLPDGLLFNSEATRLLFINAIRQARPEVIITHDPEDYHPDHRAVSQIMFEASFMAGFPNVKTEFPAHAGVPPLYYMDTLAAKNFLPAEYVDISATMSLKRDMLACHASQVDWFRENDGLDIMHLIEVVAATRGYQAGVAYAEGFRRADVWLRTPPKRVLP